MSSFLNQGETSNQEETANNTSSQTGVEQQTNEPFLAVGDRVFSTKEDVANNIESAQTHIQKLEQDFENATKLIDRQSELLEKSRRVDDILDAVKKQEPSGDAESTTQLSEEDVINKALSAFEQRQIEQTMQQEAERNWNQVTSALTQAYGDKTDEVVQKVAADNGMTLEDAASMARSYPKVFLKMFDAGSKPNPKPNTSSVNTEAFANQPSRPPRKSIMNMSARERAQYVQQRLQEFDE